MASTLPRENIKAHIFIATAPFSSDLTATCFRLCVGRRLFFFSSQGMLTASVVCFGSRGIDDAS